MPGPEQGTLKKKQPESPALRASREFMSELYLEPTGILEGPMRDKSTLSSFETSVSRSQHTQRGLRKSVRWCKLAGFCLCTLWHFHLLGSVKEASALLCVMSNAPVFKKLFALQELHAMRHYSCKGCSSGCVTFQQLQHLTEQKGIKPEIKNPKSE